MDYLDNYIGADAGQTGDENCLMCHMDRDPSDGVSHPTIFTDESNPLYGSGCEACHGPGGNHNGIAEGILNPAELPSVKANALCTMCHTPEGEFHSVVGGSCLDCHGGHSKNASFLIAKEAVTTEDQTAYMEEYIGGDAESMGNDNCIMCHPDLDPADKLNHAMYFDCEMCHGPGGNHMAVASGILNPTKMPVDDSNAICVMCHQMEGTFHDAYTTHCVDCHSGHSENIAFLKTGETEEIIEEEIEEEEVDRIAYIKTYSGANAERKGDPYCRVCHLDKIEINGYSHESIFLKEDSPLHNAGCEICHGPGSAHIGNNPGILHPGKMPKNMVNSLCTMCHVPTGEFHQAVGGYCLDCHSGHSENAKFLLAFEDDKPSEHALYMEEYIGADAETMGNDNCIMCHPDSDPADTGHHSGIFDCETCHGPGGNHNGVAQGILNPVKMPVDDVTSLCTMCHAPLGEFHEVFSGSCTNCHSGHSGNVSFLIASEYGEDEMFDTSPPVDKEVPYYQTYTGANADRWGSDLCLMCHPDYAPTSLFTHAALIDNDSHNSDYGYGCEGCHGPGGKHMGVTAGILMPVKLTSEESTELCSKCHSNLRSYDLQGWYQSEHLLSGLSCIDCHGGHSDNENFLVSDRDDFCNTCHADLRALFNMRSHHPVNEGLMECTDCHNMHSGEHENQLNIDRDELCFTCHPDKQGPFIYDHDVSMASGADGCMSCHLVHGSNTDSLLRQPQQVCNQCHTDQTPGRHFPGNCWTSGCHTEIHGSNAHPLFFY